MRMTLNISKRREGEVVDTPKSIGDSCELALFQKHVILVQRIFLAKN